MISTAELSKKEFTGITLPKPYGQLLGKVPMDVSGAIWGPKGSGKSTMAVDLAYVLANEIGKGIYCSSEEGPGPSMQGKIKRLGAEHNELLVTDFEGLDDLKAAIKYSQAKFVVLDSASMGYVKLSEFEQFHDWCKEQSVMLWYILHATKDGNYKGNTMMVHMPDIEIKVSDGLAETEKNRFAETPREMEVVFERAGRSEKQEVKRENPFQPASKEEIKRLVKLAKSNKNCKDFADISLVEKSVAKRVEALTGQKVKGFKHVLTADEIRHIFEQHGDKKKEESRGQIVITEKDFGNLISILNNPDKIKEGELSKRGLKTVVYEKKIKDKLFCVEEIRTGRKKMAIKTMWKHRIRGPRANSDKECVAHTSKTCPDHNASTCSNNTKKSDKRENPNTGTECIVSATAKTNEPENGIEIRFSDAPPKDIRDQLKRNGFTFYTPNDAASFWAAPATAKRKELIESIAGRFDSAVLGWKQKDVKSKKEEVKTKTVQPKFDGIVGDNTTIDFKADGSIQQKGEYAVLESDDVIASHNKDCSQNSKHKISKGQPRDRSLDALCSQPKFIAQNLNPSSITQGNLAFNGAPIVLPDGQVIQGNGRSIALQIAYDEHPKQAKRYKKYLVDHAGDWGLDTDELKRARRPVLVRMVDVTDKKAIELGNVVDTSQAKMSKVDQGKAYIRNMSKSKKQAVGNLINDSAGETLGEVISDVGIRIMDQFKDLDRQELVEDNSLTSEGKDFLRSVFAGLVFDSDEHKQALQHFLKLKHTQKAGLERSYGNIIPFIDSTADITDTIQQAVAIVSKVQHTDGIDTAGDFLSQSDVFSGSHAEQFSTQAAQLAKFLLDADTQKFIRNGFRMYQWKVNGKEDLFNPIEKESPDQAFKAAFVDRVRINPNNLEIGDNWNGKTIVGIKKIIHGPLFPNKNIIKRIALKGPRGGTYYGDVFDSGKISIHSGDYGYFEGEKVLDARENPADPLVFIAHTERIILDSADGQKELEGNFPTFVAGDKLYIVPAYRVETITGAVDDEQAEEEFSKWHNYKADSTDFAIDWPEKAKAQAVGTAGTIWYASDKVIQDGDGRGKTNFYVHEFDAGKRPATVKDDILIIGNITWNERGLLN